MLGRMPKRVLITGAAGFVGANLSRRLVGTSKVVATFHPSDHLWRLRGLSSKIKIVPLDMADYEAVGKLVGKLKPNYIFHLAAAGTYPNQKEFRKIFTANTVGTANLLEALRHINYRAFIMTGSSSEYGYMSKPMKETDVLEPNSYYSATKGGATLLTQAFASVEGKSTVVLRFFSIYGPWEEPGRLIPTVIAKCIKQQLIQVTGGNEVRDFVYVDDAVDALLLAAKKAQKLKGHIFNVGSGKQTKIVDVARMAIKITASNAQLKIGSYPARGWDASNWQADTTKGKTVLGWRATTPLQDGIRKTFQWLKNHLEFYP